MTLHNSLEENYVVKRFIQEVNDLVPVKDRDVVFDALKRYKSSTDLQRLIQDLKTVLDDPVKMEVFEFVRLLTRTQASSGAEIETDRLYQQFRMELFDDDDADEDKENCERHTFSKYVFSVYPDVKPKRRYVNEKKVQFFNGIQLKPLDPDLKVTKILPIDINILKDMLPSTFTVDEMTDNELVCHIKTQHSSNGHDVIKKVTFLKNGRWKVEIANKCIDIESLRITDTFKCDKENVNVICKTVEMIKVCQAISVKQSVVCSRYHTLEKWTDKQNVTTRKLRSLMCSRVLQFLSSSDACRTCNKMTFGHTNRSDKKIESTTDHPQGTNDHKVSKEEFKKLIPSASNEMLELLLNQANNAEKHPRGRRWSKIVISVCLQLYNRSPQGYSSLRSSNLLILPSPSLLVLYKNSVHQMVGFQKDIFQWMFKEAMRLQIPQEGWVGGVIIDEMAIQEDLQILKNGDAVELVGFADLGGEGNMCKTLTTGKNEKQLGNHVLQFVFLGLTGFRFPFAHFLSNQVQATELHTLFWESVDNLQMYGFHVAFTCMDGAQSNRSFLHINLGQGSTSSTSMNVKNPCDLNESVIFMMDYSHCIKKVRNNILKSGLQKGCTRNLTLPNNEIIQWQMWIDCYHWDRQNALQIHRHLTNEHIFPSQQTKMRNHLAEEVLNEDMLHLFQMYQSALGAKGAVLNGAIQLIQKTSRMITIFRDTRPVTGVNDIRLQQLQEVLSWFVEWKKEVKENVSLSNKEKEQSLMSYQCLEDISSCIIGFVELCAKLLHNVKDKHVFITPALINSDVIENEFNQQRSTYNGANSNPNAVQYRKSLNSIILGQSVISKKANAAKCNPAACAQPYIFENQCPLRKKKKKSLSDESQPNIKLIRY